MFLKGGTLKFGFGFDFGDDYMQRLKLLVCSFVGFEQR